MAQHERKTRHQQQQQHRAKGSRLDFKAKRFCVCVYWWCSRIECSKVQRLQAQEWNLSMVLATTFTKSQALSSPLSDGGDDFSTLNGFFSSFRVFTSFHCYMIVCVCCSSVDLYYEKKISLWKSAYLLLLLIHSSSCYNQKLETCTALAIANFFSMLSLFVDCCTLFPIPFHSHRVLSLSLSHIYCSFISIIFQLVRHFIDLFIPFANAMQKMSLMLLLLLYLAVCADGWVFIWKMRLKRIEKSSTIGLGEQASTSIPTRTQNISTWIIHNSIMYLNWHWIRCLLPHISMWRISAVTVTIRHHSARLQREMCLWGCRWTSR